MGRRPLIKAGECEDVVGAKVIELLSQDLDFRGEASNYASHNFHSFPAKFPPQLPHKFILALTEPGDVILDPMMGSGTTIVEAYLSGRQAIGRDIDPLAVLISRVKTTPSDVEHLRLAGEQICQQASIALNGERNQLEQALSVRWDTKTKEFIDYWFAPETQLELLALVHQIDQLTSPSDRDFFRLALSSIIITKSGGVSLALDLGHTRPHKAKLVEYRARQPEQGSLPLLVRDAYPASKTIGSAISEFRRRVQKNVLGLPQERSGLYVPDLTFGNAQALTIPHSSVDLIVTSPPYPSNAIDYMRAHKFSLVWLGFDVTSLSQKRKEYIGGEVPAKDNLESLPPKTLSIVDAITAVDRSKGQAVRRYYCEMSRVLREMHRVLRPGKVGIVVVGSSVLRSVSTQTGECIAEIGATIGFEVPKIGLRNLDRDRRMMPAGRRSSQSQIEQRMHQEHIIGFVKA